MKWNDTIIGWAAKTSPSSNQKQVIRECKALVDVLNKAEEHILELASSDNIENVEPKDDPLLKAVLKARQVFNYEE